MPAFAWRQRDTRHFGKQWTPFAELDLKSSQGRWYQFSLQVDTGAVISVLPRSAAQLIGIPPNSGELIDMAGVSAPARPYLLHCVAARIGDSGEFPMRIAFAEREDVPALLGRLDVLGRFQIDLDPSLEETRIFVPHL